LLDEWFSGELPWYHCGVHRKIYHLKSSQNNLKDQKTKNQKTKNQKTNKNNKNNKTKQKKQQKTKTLKQNPFSK